MENYYNHTPLTLLFSPNCQKCAIVNLKHAQKAPLGQSFCPLLAWGFLQGAMHAAWASGVLARGKRMILLPPSAKVCGHSRPMGFCEVGDAMHFPLEPLPPFGDSASWPLKGEWTDTAGRVDGLGVTEGTSAAEGRCNKRSALRSPLQHAAKPVAVRCVGLCTALLHFGQNHVVRLGAHPTALHSRFSVVGNRFSSPRPMQPACLLSGLCNACRLLSLSLLLRKSPQGNLLSPGG